MTEETLFELALQTPEANRAALLDRECAGNPELRARVEALLKADAASSPLLQQLPRMDATTGFQATASYSAGEQPSTIIAGRYTLVEPIGEGGMGTIWRAKQTEPVKRFVAIKLIKAGMDSRQVLARFEAERQALALMDHPNIAKVLDGGLHENRPFFVMELVKGVPITNYCDHHKLTPQHRLELFVAVCQAIQHAHQKGIIHRDIKPSNVLVAMYDDKPVVKVIDFGVAKATGGTLTEATIDTGFGGVVGTPQYMSPEQATFNNLDIDTRSDVYALGVLLYELLTGSPPFSKKELEQKGLLEMLRVVREEEPPRPSTRLSMADALPTLSANRGTEPKKLTGLLRNELDWIVMKALEKERSRRYETANGFAADVLRYLSGEPVTAVPPSAGYRLKKFVKRNKGKVVAAGTILGLLIAGICGTTYGLIQANHATEAERLAKIDADTRRKEAESQQRRAEAGEKLAEDRLVQVESEKKKTEEEKQIALAVRNFLQNKLLGQADAWNQSNAILKSGGRSEELKENPTIRELLDRAAKELTAENIENNFPKQLRLQAEILQTVGNTYIGVGEFERAIGLLDRSVALRKQHLGIDHEETITSMSKLGEACWHAGKTAQAIKFLEQVWEIEKKKLGAEHPNTLTTMASLAQMYESAGRNAEAVKLLEFVRDKEALILASDSRGYLSTLAALASAYGGTARFPEAIELFQKVLDAQEKKLGLEHPDTIVTIANLATAYKSTNQLDKALPLYEKSVKLAKEKFGSKHPYTIVAMSNLGGAYLAADKLNLALPLLEEALGLAKQKLGLIHSDTLIAMSELATAYRANRQLDLALPLFEQTLQLLKEKLGHDHPDTLKTMGLLAKAYQDAKKLDLAFPLLEQTLKLEEIKLGLDHPETLASMNNLAAAYWMEKQLDKSIPLFEETLKRREAKFGRDSLDSLLVIANLGVNYKDARRFTEAMPLLEEVLHAMDKYPTLQVYRTAVYDCSLEAGKFEQAAAMVKPLLAEKRNVFPKESPRLAAWLSSYGLSLIQAKAFTEAEALLRECLAIREKQEPDVWTTFTAKSLLGHALMGQKKYADAEPLLLAGYEGMKQREKSIPDNGKLRLTQALDRLIQFYTEINKADEVKKWQAERAKYLVKGSVQSGKKP